MMTLRSRLYTWWISLMDLTLTWWGKIPGSKTIMKIRHYLRKIFYKACHVQMPYLQQRNVLQNIWFYLSICRNHCIALQHSNSTLYLTHDFFIFFFHLRMSETGKKIRLWVWIHFLHQISHFNTAQENECH